MVDLAMFPLGMVLLPGAVLPLQVFEPRYLQMFRELLERSDDPPEFGVVLITRGREAGGGDERAMVATRARVVDMQATPDGRYLLAAVGTERLRVREWLEDDPYPRAVVEAWPDEPVPVDGVDGVDVHVRLAAVHARYAHLADLAAELGEPIPSSAEFSDDPAVASYQIAVVAPLGPADRYQILVAPSLADRLDALQSAVDDAVAVREFRRS